MFFRRARIVPRSQELVFLDADDDLGTIRSKLESSSAEEIYLVIPRRSSVLRTPLEFRILARVANEMSSETVLVTDDPSRRRLANQEGFRTRRGPRTLNQSVDVSIDPDAKAADPASATLPANVLSVPIDVSGSLQIPSDRTIGSDKAHG